jgi:hypothetical protein
MTALDWPERSLGLIEDMARADRRRQQWSMHAVGTIVMTGKASNEEHREHAFVRYANGDDFDGHATIRVEPCANCDGECGNEYVVLRIAGQPDADRDTEVVWDKEEAERIAAAILRAAKVIPAPSLN